MFADNNSLHGGLHKFEIAGAANAARGLTQ